MVIIGAKGHAKEILEVLYQKYDTQSLYFFDNISKLSTNQLFDKFPILRDYEEVAEVFKIDRRFATGIGGIFAKEKLVLKFEELGGIYTSVIAKNANIGTFKVNLYEGVNIMQRVFISNDVTIGRGTLVNYNASIHHDCLIDDFCEISPCVQILGRAKIGKYTSVGSGTIILPDTIIGSNVVIGAGSVITKDVPSASLVVGIPGEIKRKIEPHS